MSKRAIENKRKQLHQANLAKTKKNAVCTFQIIVENKNLGYNIECGLTETATMAGAYSGREITRWKCNPDMCPMYQNWQQNRKIISWLEMEK